MAIEGDDAGRADGTGLPGKDLLETDLLETVETDTGPDPRWTVLWLHGLGADGHDFAPIVPELVRREWPALRFVFPHAPVRAVTINAGMRMRAWYDIRSLDPRDFDLATRADEGGVDASVAQVGALLDREHARGVPSSRIVLAGFSQGGAIALAAGLRRREPLAGIVALSTYLPLGGRSLEAATEAARAQPLFMAHGSADPVVPFVAGQRSAELLRARGFDVDWHVYPMAHQVCAPEIADLAAWLDGRFAA